MVTRTPMITECIISIQMSKKSIAGRFLEQIIYESNNFYTACGINKLFFLSLSFKNAWKTASVSFFLKQISCSPIAAYEIRDNFTLSYKQTKIFCFLRK